MATKAQLIDFIMCTFVEPEGNPVSKTKLESCKKSELESFIKDKGLEGELNDWLTQNT